MTAITFDTLKLARRLEEAGVDRKVAEAQAEGLAEALDTGIEDLVTKADLHAEAQSIRQDLRVFEEQTRGNFVLLRWMVGFNMAATVAVLWMLFKLVAA